MLKKGDFANDKSLIMEAHKEVGIMGKEESQENIKLKKAIFLIKFIFIFTIKIFLFVRMQKKMIIF